MSVDILCVADETLSDWICAKCLPLPGKQTGQVIGWLSGSGCQGGTQRPNTAPSIMTNSFSVVAEGFGIKIMLL